MAKRSSASQAGNSVVQATETVCGMYGVPYFRMQSRVMTVVGEGGRSRPMFMGKWTDFAGVEHYGGMADLLLMPKFTIWCACDNAQSSMDVTVALWVECKAGSGALRKEQRAFRDFVLSAGAEYLELRDSADDLIAWFKKWKVERR